MMKTDVITSSHRGKVLVVGATGATGKHVVQQLLARGQFVKVIVRSKQAMMEALCVSAKNKENNAEAYDHNVKNLEVQEASLLDLSIDELLVLVQDVDAVISCLGNRVVYTHPRQFCTDAVRNLTNALILSTTSSRLLEDSINTQPTLRTAPRKFILMNSAGVAHPNGTEAIRPWWERLILVLCRWLVPSFADNEAAAHYLYHTVGVPSTREPSVEWTVVRPTNLVAEDASSSSLSYQAMDHPVGPLFGPAHVTRAQVARFMVDLALEDTIWNQYKYRMPAVYDSSVDWVVPTTRSNKKHL
jgi:nucleoside-diphosphate-sugar epimerase